MLPQTRSKSEDAANSSRKIIQPMENNFFDA